MKKMWEKGHYANKCPQKITLLEQINNLDIEENIKYKMYKMIGDESKSKTSHSDSDSSDNNNSIDEIESNCDYKNNINYFKVIIQANGLE